MPKTEPVKRQTIKRWVHQLEDPDAELTLEELTLLSLIHIREQSKETAQALGHLEGQLARLEQRVWGVNPAETLWESQQAIPARSRAYDDR